MNEHVKYSLNLYLEDTDPQYAILLKGDWGCGKTHFIKEWIKEQDNNNASVYDVVYVSLFGLSTIKGLVDSINKTLSPMFYKIEKHGKEVLKAAAKIILKYNTSIDDLKFDLELNPLDLLAQLNIAENSKEYKLFVLDDVERCDIPLKELFGLVNYICEHVGSKVILVLGKTDLQDATWKETLRKYQEKIVGREYEIAPDVDAAISSFIDEIKSIYPVSYEFLLKQRESITLVWECSKYCNLRSLRQCLRSFAEIYASLDDGAIIMKQQFLANYLAYSLEYYNGDKTIFQDLATYQLLRYNSNNTPAKKMVDKYNLVWQKMGRRLFDLEYLDIIKTSVIDGKNFNDLLNLKIKAINNKSLTERFKEIIYMENHDVDLLIREAKDYVSTPISSLVDYLQIVYMLCYWEEKEVCILKKSFEKDCFKMISIWIKQNMCPSQISSVDIQISRGFAIQEREHPISRYTWLFDNVYKFISDLKIEVKEPILILLEGISNKNLEELIDLMSQPDIYAHANYDMQSIFNRINIYKFCKGVRRLNNRNKMKLSESLAARYSQNFSYSDYNNIFGEDEFAIQEMRNVFEGYKKQSAKITKIAYVKLIEPLDYALNRLRSKKEY